MEHFRDGRRAFVKNTMGLGAAVLVSPRAAFNANAEKSSADDLFINIFSKHLQFLNYKDMAEVAAELGFDGVDLTVRPKGHVEPERVDGDLPLAVMAIKDAGLQPHMMVTNVVNADDDIHRKLLDTASTQGLKYYRMGYVNFHEDRTIPQSLADYHQAMLRLAKYNDSLGITGAYQNHAGMRVGAEVWDLYHLMAGIPPTQLGVQYDIRHAMVEGGTSWRNGLKLIEKQISSIVIKDYVWLKEQGKWKVKNVPLGEGMVDWLGYFKLLKSLHFNLPVTIHYEYDLGGVEHGDRKIVGMTAKEVFNNMKRDLQLVRKLWKEA